MLKELNIRNFAIIDSLSISFEKGFTVLTGETGAGKSIIIDALSLLLGAKASSDIIKSGTKEAFVEAIFDPISHPLLQELSIDQETFFAEPLVLRRIVSTTGKSKSFINDMTVSLQTLSAISKSLISIHGQHEHQTLLKKDTHINFLDTYAGINEKKFYIRQLYNSINDIKVKISQMQQLAAERQQRIDFLQYQIQEIVSASLKEGEFEALEIELYTLLNAERLKDIAQSAYLLLYSSETSCLSQIASVYQNVCELARHDPKATAIKELFDTAMPYLQDASIALRDIKDNYEADPLRAENINNRLNTIKKIFKKYGADYSAVMRTQESLQKELDDLINIEQVCGDLDTQLHKLINEYELKANELSSDRLTAAENIRAKMLEELQALGFQNADFKVQFARKDYSHDGIDDVEFVFNANPGEPLRPLQKVASGGELSRIMLALKCVDKSNEAVVMVFDEIDAGVGGQTALHIGERLCKVAVNAQALCVTHLPQIAALAQRHLKVNKQIQDNKTTINLQYLNHDERVKEVARMLSGKITEASLRHASELLLSK